MMSCKHTTLRMFFYQNLLVTMGRVKLSHSHQGKLLYPLAISEEKKSWDRMLRSPQMSSELRQAAKWMGHRAGSTNARAFRESVDYIGKGSSKRLQTNRDFPLCSHGRPRKPAVIQIVLHNPPLYSFHYTAW